MPVVARLETSALATTVRDSSLLTGLLSGIHLVGLTIIVGAALIAALSVFGWLPTPDDGINGTRGARRAIGIGLMVSLVSGGLLVLPRLSMALAARTFQIKMALLLAAGVFHFAGYRRALGAGGWSSRALAGGISVVLWYAVALAGCAFILYE